MTPAIHASSLQDAISVAADIARRSGLTVEEPVLLQSTNNAVAWLRPANVVAKVSLGRNARLHTDLTVAQQLYEAGAPVVSPVSAAKSSSSVRIGPASVSTATVACNRVSRRDSPLRDVSIPGFERYGNYAELLAIFLTHDGWNPVPECRRRISVR